MRGRRTKIGNSISHRTLFNSGNKKNENDDNERRREKWLTN